LIRGDENIDLLKPLASCMDRRMGPGSIGKPSSFAQLAGYADVLSGAV